MTSAFAFAEFAFVASLISLLFWFAPDGLRPSWSGFFSGDEGTVSFEFYVSIAYSIAVLFLEPFYVAAGFGMYLGRRVELEAWDIEQELRRAFA